MKVTKEFHIELAGIPHNSAVVPRLITVQEFYERHFKDVPFF